MALIVRDRLYFEPALIMMGIQDRIDMSRSRGSKSPIRILLFSLSLPGHVPRQAFSRADGLPEPQTYTFFAPESQKESDSFSPTPFLKNASDRGAWVAQ